MNDSILRRPSNTPASGVDSPGRTLKTLARTALLGLAALPLVASCGGEAPKAVGANASGSLLANPASGFLVIVDPTTAGNASQLGLVKFGWGRLVDVYSEESPGVEPLLMRDFLINPNLITNGNYRVETQTLTGRDRLVVRRPQSDANFRNLLLSAGNGLSPIQDVGLGGSGFFNMVPRNAAIQIQFDDLLLASSIDERTIRVSTGLPAITPQEVRILPDPNYGDLIDKNGDGVREFYTSRVLLDFSVSEFESFQSDPPLSPNNLGTPPSFDTNQANLSIRIPTLENSIIGQEQVVRNVTNHPLATHLSGTVDFGSSTRDVVRNMRSGGPNNLTGDPYNGFLRDDVSPRIVGRLDADITVVPLPDPNAPGDATRFVIPTILYSSAPCAQQLVTGDVLRQGTVLARVVGPSTAPFNGSISSIPVQLLTWPEAFGDAPEEWPASQPASVEVLSAWDPIADAGKEGCFLDIFPTPANVNADPVANLFTNSSFGLRFDEPMAAESIEAFETMRVTRKDPTDPTFAAYDNVVGQVGGSLDLLEFRLIPNLPLAHTTGQAEPYFFMLGDGLAGPTDLAGNSLQATLPTVMTTLQTTAATQVTSGRVSLFNRADEDLEKSLPEDPYLWTEWGGDIVYLTQLGSIRPRPLTRFMGVVSREGIAQVGNNPAFSGDQMINAMTAVPLGTNEPLNPLGSRLQTVWRFVDMGLPFQDPLTFAPITTHTNLDVEGLRWSPIGGQVVVDNFSQFEMRLTHSGLAPDEVIAVPPPMLPIFPQSGMLGTFDNNILSATEDPYRIVHEKGLGYSVNPGDRVQVGNSTILMPWPMNRTIPPSQHRYYTYRDTTIQARGGPNITGVLPNQWYTTTGDAQPLYGNACDPTIDPPNRYYGANNVQTLGLPLLMEFRCYPDDGAIGVNQFDVSLALTTSTQPYFRAYSSGGTDTSLNDITRDPDLELLANGGFDPTSLPNPGVPLFGRDQRVYLGGVDFVVRTSRTFSVWWDVVDKNGLTNLDAGAQITNPLFSEATFAPRIELQPNGTNIEIEYRAASFLATHPDVPSDVNGQLPAGDALLANPAFWARQAAIMMDPYGDVYDPALNISPCDGSPNFNLLQTGTPTPQVNTPITFLNGDNTWKSSAAALDGASFYQVRITFTSNAETGLSPMLSAFGMNWRQ